MLYRVFPMTDGAPPAAPGGAGYVPRVQQGRGRHDQPDHYGAFYCSRSPEGAVAEHIQAYRGRTLLQAALRGPGGSRAALAAFDDSALPAIVDLDDPRELVRLGLRPSVVASRDRAATSAIALRVFEEGASGLGWWSTLDASWANVTLFAERALDHLVIEGTEPLTTRHPALRAAAEILGVRLA